MTIESELTTNSADFDPIFPDLRVFPETEFSLEYFTEMLPSYIFRPSVVKYGILSNNRRSKLHSVIDCLFVYETSPSESDIPNGLIFAAQQFFSF